VVLVGSVAAQYPEGHVAFWAGAATASLSFFAALGYGARLLAPVFSRPGAWRVLDGVVGILMLTLAVTVLAG
jgi:L-lysine exporter family protein LysE/ArgO